MKDNTKRSRSEEYVKAHTEVQNTTRKVLHTLAKDLVNLHVDTGMGLVDSGAVGIEGRSSRALYAIIVGPVPDHMIVTFRDFMDGFTSDLAQLPGVTSEQTHHVDNLGGDKP